MVNENEKWRRIFSAGRVIEPHYDSYKQDSYKKVWMAKVISLKLEVIVKYETHFFACLY